MKAKTLTTIAGAILLAGSAALAATVANVHVSEEAMGHTGRSVGAVAPPAISVVVTTRRAMPGHKLSGAWTAPGARSAVWEAAPSSSRDRNEPASDPRS